MQFCLRPLRGQYLAVIAAHWPSWSIMALPHRATRRGNSFLPRSRQSLSPSRADRLKD
jgi:hypothetical protein